MNCPFCQSKSHVSNSRSTAKGTQTWRRRACTACGTIWSTRETIAIDDTYSVFSNGASEPFSADKLFLSIKDSLQHRKSSLTDARGLTDTIIYSVLLLKSASVERQKLIEISYTCLRRFDKTASAVYKAKYGR